MAGVKGRSGRRTTSEGEKRRAVLQKAWDVLYDALHSGDVQILEKARLAQPLAVKDIPQELKHSGEMKTNFQVLLDGHTDKADKEAN